jgi:hypothetical protein
VDWARAAQATAQPLCGFLGAWLSIDDFALRPVRMLAPDEILATGKYRYRFCPYTSRILIPHDKRIPVVSEPHFGTDSGSRSARRYWSDRQQARERAAGIRSLLFTLTPLASKRLLAIRLRFRWRHRTPLPLLPLPVGGHAARLVHIQHLDDKQYQQAETGVDEFA